jgi:hypothetical protein
MTAPATIAPAPSGRCAQCWDWRAPFSFAVPSGAPAMRYEHWILYHLHIVLHQGGVPLA